MTNKLLLVFIISISLTACGDNKESTKKTNEFDINKNIGWMHGHCFVIENSDLKPSTRIDIISFGQTQIHLQARIKAKVKSEINCVPLLSDRKEVNQTENRSFYILDIPKEHEEILAIGIINLNSKLKTVNGLIQTDINNNSIKESYSTCSGSEGINFSMSEKQGNKVNTLWESYYYLGYDITPDCPQ